jgi:hypothetical protein
MHEGEEFFEGKLPILTSRRLSACIIALPTGRILFKFDIAEFDGKRSINSRFTYNQAAKILDTIREDLNIFPIFDNDICTSKVRIKYIFAFS